MAEDEIGGRKTLSINDMWSCVKGDDKNWGIDGYEVPKDYLDYRKSMWEKSRADILKKNKRVWPPPDWPKDKETDKSLPPKRPNYLDQVYKWANSFYDPQKAKDVIERLAEHNRPIDKPPEPKKQIDKRKQFLDRQEEIQKARKERPELPDYKQEAIEKVKEKIEIWKKENTQTAHEKLIEKYKKKGSLPTCDRVTVVADAEHVGEKLPFYNTYKKDGEDNQSDDENKKKKKNALFFPNKTAIWTTAPSWSYKKKDNKPNEFIQTRENLLKEKLDTLFEGKKIEPIDVAKTFYNLSQNKYRGFQYKEPTDLTKIEQYQTWKQTNNRTTPGPQHYWKVKSWAELKGKKDEKGKPEPDDKVENVPGEPKIYLLNRKKTDQRVYKPLKSHIF